MQFFDTPTEDSNLIYIEWVKEYGGGKLGHALPVTIEGFDFSTIQIQLGDSFCNGTWEPYTEKTIKENLVPGGGDYLLVGEKKSHICGYLKNFLFDPKKIDYKVGLLSGGERNRLLLAKILADPKEILILDEPTNDLDMETIDILIDFLKVYDGGVLVASHDKDFLEQVVDKYLFFDGNGNYNISLRKHW